MNKWHELVKLIPNYSGNKWTISNPIRNEKISIPAEILSEYIIESGDNYDLLDNDLKKLSLIDNDDEICPDIKEWIEQGWEQSLYYYSASRDIEYVDDDIDTSKRMNAIEQELNGYLNGQDYPLPKRRKVDISLNEENSKERSLGWILQNRSCTDPMEAVIDFFTDDLGELLEGSLSFLRRNYLLKDASHFNKEMTMDTFGRPFRYYIINYGIKDLDMGVYQYDLIDHGLSIIKYGDFRNEVVDCLIGHKTSKNSSFSIVMVADLKIWQWFYRHERALRNLYIDGGAIMQSLLLNATRFELKTHITPASHDSMFNKLLDLEEYEEQVFYTLTAG